MNRSYVKCFDSCNSTMTQTSDLGRVYEAFAHSGSRQRTASPVTDHAAKEMYWLTGRFCFGIKS